MFNSHSSNSLCLVRFIYLEQKHHSPNEIMTTLFVEENPSTPNLLNIAWQDFPLHLRGQVGSENGEAYRQEGHCLVSDGGGDGGGGDGGDRDGDGDGADGDGGGEDE